MLILLILSYLLRCALSAAVTNARSTPAGISEAEAASRAQAQDCHNVMAKAAQEQIIFLASDVFDCLKNVPFSIANGNRFIDFYNKTLQYQSTLAFLADPPPGYQQPAVNVGKVLSTIKENVNAGKYTSQYAFEAEIHYLINRMHDNHVFLEAGMFAPFSYVSPYSLVSASIDGKQAPEVYLWEDVVYSQLQGWTPSPVTNINGKDAIQYLSDFAGLHSDGYVESNADWNSLMDSPARDVQYGLSLFQRGTFYPGKELNFAFANGSMLETEWLALYTHDLPTGPLSTPGDFYNYFVLGLVPAGFDPNEPTVWWSDKDVVPNNTTPAEQEGIVEDYGCGESNLSHPDWCFGSAGAYPTNPIVTQKGLGLEFGEPGAVAGAISGYMLDDISTAVLSVPSFFMEGQTVLDFDMTVEDFIGNATARKAKRLVIDLQQNGGGMSLLALTMFKKLFNGLEPYTGSRMRSHEAANILGTTYSEWWKSLEVFGNATNSSDYQNLADSEWVVRNRINPATGRNFSSWKEYFGPLDDRGDGFSQQQLYNLSDTVFDAALFEWIPLDYTETNSSEPESVWSPDDIVLLTDGICASACVLFVELMTQIAGVRSIAVGGRPVPGPMQKASGTRGARFYTDDELLFDYEFLSEVIGDESALSRLPNRDDTGISLSYLSFNIRDQMRKDGKIPLQFKYDAAQCRIYYTLDNVYNMTRLWRDAVAATWEDPSLCVQNSTGYATGPNADNSTINAPPDPVAQFPDLNLENVRDAGFLINTTGGLINDGHPLGQARPPLVQECTQFALCAQNEACQTHSWQCAGAAGIAGQAFTKSICHPCPDCVSGTKAITPNSGSPPAFFKPSFASLDAYEKSYCRVRKRPQPGVTAGTQPGPVTKPKPVPLPLPNTTGGQQKVGRVGKGAFRGPRF